MRHVCTTACCCDALQADVVLMWCCCGALQADVVVMEAAQSSKQAQLALFQEEQKRIEEDIYVPLRLKQGQVEIQPQGIVDSSMEDAVLVALQLVQVGCGAWGLWEGLGGWA